MTTDEIAVILEGIAPRGLAESWDNPGWQVHVPAATLAGILLALDATPEALDEATRFGCNLLFTHHPAIFKPIFSLDVGTPRGTVLAEAIRRQVSIWSAHTNLDVMPDGTSLAMAKALGLRDTEVLSDRESSLAIGCGYGAIGAVDPPVSTVDFARRAATVLSSAVCQVAARSERMHSRIAVMGGSGTAFIDDAIRKDATLFVTADVRYHDAQDAVAKGLDLVILDHFATERPVLDLVRTKLIELLPDIPVHLSSTPSTPYLRVEP